MGAHAVAGQFQGLEQGLRARLERAPRVLAALAVAVAGVAAALLFAGGAADSQTRFLPPIPTVSNFPDPQTPVGAAPTGYGASYDVAVRSMTQVNHLLEQRQTELFYASTRGDSAEVVADLRRRVEALERSYADAITAMGRATR
jgi:hypothetical protein